MIKGVFKSIWSNGEITTPGELDEYSSHISTKVINVDNNYETLESEVFICENGVEYSVCPNCHEFILKYEIIEGIGKTLYEKKYCPDCGFSEY